jgi:hypothetical protein
MQTITYEQQELRQDGRKMRRDARPDHVGYQDTGCVLSPSCLRCPLERCRYDQPGGVRKLRATDRDETLRRFYDEGTSIDALAARYDLSRRSVFRILAKGD